MTIIFDIVKILRKEDRLKFIYLFFLVLINVFLEMFGIGLIFPILGFLISDAFLIKYSDYLQILSPFFEINRNNLIIFFSIVLVLVFVLKNLIHLYFSFYKYRFTYNLLNYFSEKLFLKYINKDILFFNKTNTSIPIRNIDNVGIFTESFNQFLYILIDIIFFISVLVLLLYINFLNTIYLLIITSIAIYFFRFFTKDRLIDLGNKDNFICKKESIHF